MRIFRGPKPGNAPPGNSGSGVQDPYAQWLNGLSYTELLQERSRLCDIIQSPQSDQVSDQETLEPFRANLVLVEALMANMKALPSDEFVCKINCYRALCQAESDLSDTVNYLRLQMAGFGPMRVPVNLAMQLKNEETKLARVREELKYLEDQLRANEEISADERTEMDDNRMTQLQRDIEAKREEERFYEKSIALLEKRAAEQGADLTPDVNNEIEWTESIINRIRAERIQLENELETDFGLTPGSIPNFSQLSHNELWTHVDYAYR